MSLEADMSNSVQYFPLITYPLLSLTGQANGDYTGNLNCL